MANYQEITGSVQVQVHTKKTGDLIPLLEEALTQAKANKAQLLAKEGEEKQVAFQRLDLGLIFAFVHRS